MQPDIVVPARSALRLATRALLKDQLAVERDPARRIDLQRWLEPTAR